MENTFCMNRFKVRYVKNCSLLWPEQEIVTTYILAKDTDAAIQYVRCLPGFAELRSIDFDPLI
jgi:hypothetical protein